MVDYFVSHLGDNSNGETWATAYRLPTTLIAANKAGGPHRAFVAPGAYYDQAIVLSNASWSGLQLLGTNTHGSVDPAGIGQVIISGGYDTTQFVWGDQGGGVFKNSTPASIAVLPKCIWIGDQLLIADGLAATTPTSGHWGYTGTGPYVLYVNCDGEQSPPVDGSLRIPKNNHVLLTGQPNQQTKYLTLETANTTVGGIYYNNQTSGAVLNNCGLRYSNLHLAYLDLVTENDSQVVNNCVFSGGKSPTGTASVVRSSGGGVGSALTIADNLIDAPYSLGIAYSTTIPQSTVIRDNTIRNLITNSSTSTAIVVGPGAIVYNNIIDSIGSVNAADVQGIRIPGDGAHVYNNTISNVRGIGILVNNADSNLIHDNTISNCGYTITDQISPFRYPSSFLKYTTGAGGCVSITGTSESNKVCNNRCFDSYGGIGIITTGGAGGNEITSNACSNFIVNGVGIYKDASPANKNKICNNFVYHNPSIDNNPTCTGHGFHAQDVDNGGVNAVFANNLCINAAISVNSHAFFVSVNSGTVSIDVDNNDWHALSGGVNTRILDTSFTDIDLYKAAIQADSHFSDLNGVQANTEKNTIFTDPQVNSLGKLLSTSPCIDKGVYIAGINMEGQADPWDKKVYSIPNIGVDQGAGMPNTGPHRMLQLGTNINIFK